ADEGRPRGAGRSAAPRGHQEGGGRRMTVLRGAVIVQSLDPVRIVVGDLLVEGGRVVGTGSFNRRLVRDCSGCLVVPGNVSAHTHLYSALARGMPYALDAPENFVQILQRVWW